MYFYFLNTIIISKSKETTSEFRRVKWVTTKIVVFTVSTGVQMVILGCLDLQVKEKTSALFNQVQIFSWQNQNFLSHMVQMKGLIFLKNRNYKVHFISKNPIFSCQLQIVPEILLLSSYFSRGYKLYFSENNLHSSGPSR